jgi:outer membrane protein assembly factor BamB
MKRFVLCCALLNVATVGESSDNWPDWRGPGGNSVVTGGDFPTSWGEDKNIIWKTATPGWGTSTPAVWGDSVFITAAEKDGKNQLVSYDRQGNQQWKVEFGTAIPGKNRKAGGANPSPVTDGSLVVAYFKNGDLACVDFSGKVVWSMNLQDEYGPDRLQWDLGTSPVLTSNAVVIAVMHQGPSFLVALDKQTGELLWKTERDLGAPAEARDSYSTPVVVSDNGMQRLIVLGADHVTSYDAATGKEIWRAGNLNPGGARNFRSIASPAVADGLVFAPYARGDSLTAIRRGGSGDVTSTHVAWTLSDAGADVPTPVAVDGKVYVCRDRGDILCLAAATGKQLWSETLPRKRDNYSSSPVIVNDHLYATREDGTTFVLQLGDTPKLISENTLREYTYATPVFVDGRIYLRTSDWLFCIGQKDGE